MDITNRFMAAAGNLPRNDLFVCDSSPVSKQAAMVLVAYAPGLQAPRPDDMYAWARTAFAGKLVPQVSTFKVHPHDNCVSLLLTANMQQRPESDKATMRAITATTFCEDKTASLWSLVQNVDGTRYLVRNHEENVADIVATASRTNPHNPGARLATVKTAAPHIDLGDHVKFFGPRNESLYGCVKSMNGEYVTIHTPHDDQTHTVSKYQVTEVTAKGADAKSREKANLEDFFAKAYGSREFAQAFTRRDANDETIRSTVPVFSR